MRGRQKFFHCSLCGNLVGLLGNTGVPMVCCGQEMSELVPNTVEASTEKHVPDVSVEAMSCAGGNVCTCIRVQVGSVPHPMEEAHNIPFVYVETERGGQRRLLKADEEPKVDFNIVNDKPVAVFAYCNLHGLWKTELV